MKELSPIVGRSHCFHCRKAAGSSFHHHHEVIATLRLRKTSIDPGTEGCLTESNHYADALYPTKRESLSQIKQSLQVIRSRAKIHPKGPRYSNILYPDLDST